MTHGYAVRSPKGDGVISCVEKSVVPDRYFYVLDFDGNIWEVDGYKTIGSDKHEHWQLHLTCAKCNRHVRLDSMKKPFQVTERGIETGEPIKCPWPAPEEQFSDGGACNWCVELTLPAASQTTVRLRDKNDRPIEVRLDAVMRRA